MRKAEREKRSNTRVCVCGGGVCIFSQYIHSSRNLVSCLPFKLPREI